LIEDFQEELKKQYKQQQQEVKIPGEVKKFILNFHRILVEHSYHDLGQIYEILFNRLTEQYYKNQPWPEAVVIAPLVNNGIYIKDFYL